MGRPLAWPFGLLLPAWVSYALPQPSIEMAAHFINSEVEFLKALKYAVEKRDEAFLRGVLKKAYKPEGFNKKKTFGRASLASFPSKVFVPKNSTSDPHYSVLHYACLGKALDDKTEKAGHVRALLDAGLDKDLSNREGIRPLHVASANGNVETVGVLLGSGADASGPNMTAAAMAAELGLIEILRAFRNAGGEAMQSLLQRDNVQREPRRWSPLLYAVHNLHVHVITFLIVEVGWGDTTKDEVLAAAEEEVRLGRADASLVELLQKLGDPNSDYFKEQKRKHTQEPRPTNGEPIQKAMLPPTPNRGDKGETRSSVVPPPTDDSVRTKRGELERGPKQSVVPTPTVEGVRTQKTEQKDMQKQQKPKASPPSSDRKSHGALPPTNDEVRARRGEKRDEL